MTTPRRPAPPPRARRAAPATRPTRRRASAALGLATLLAVAAVGLLVWPDASDEPIPPTHPDHRAAAAPTPTDAPDRAGPHRPASTATRPARALSDPPAPGDALAAHRDRLRRRAQGRTFAQTLDDLARFGDGGTLPDHKRWLWEVTGLLALHPELCHPLAEAALDPARNLTARALVADLLANVSAPEAQAALRHLVDGAPDDAAGRARLLQSVVLVAHPEPETLDWLQAATRGPDALAASVALGAAAGRSAAEHAERAVAHLLAVEAAAEAPEAQAAHLLALGNARHADAAPTLIARAAHPDAEIRGAAARALAHTPGAEAGEALHALLADADPEVVRRALAALGARGLDPAGVDAVTGLLEVGRLDLAAQHQLLSALAQPNTPPELALQLAEALAHHATDNRVRNAARDRWHRG